MGGPVPDDRTKLASRLAARDSVLRLCARGAAELYTTNAIESLHMQLRKIIKTRGHFPNDEAATKLIWLALRNITATWVRGARTWKEAMNQFAILYEDRFTTPNA
jgi:transposase-like protein